MRSILRMEVGHQVFDAVERAQSALAGLAHGGCGGGIGSFDLEGQSLFCGDAGQQDADCVGDGQAHSCKRFGGPLLDPLVDADVNHFGGGHGCSVEIHRISV